MNQAQTIKYLQTQIKLLEKKQVKASVDKQTGKSLFKGNVQVQVNDYKSKTTGKDSCIIKIGDGDKTCVVWTSMKNVAHFIAKKA